MTDQDPITPTFHRGSVSASREQTNPLRSLTISRAISLMESAQRGDFLELQWLYWFIEQTEPILIALQERRYGRLAEMDWEAKVIPRQRRRAAFDSGLAAEQAAALAEMYDRIDNLKEAIEHAASATFRLYAHLNVQRNDAGDVAHLEPLDQWNFLRDGMFGDWYWNPEATVTNWRSLPAANRLAPEDFIIRQVARHIDRPGLIKQIRKNLGEKDWSGFLEIYGIPTPIIIMPTGAKDSDKNLYEGACSAIAQGRPVALPAGSDARYPGEVRGNAPFKEYLDWCDGQLVLIGTGGLLSMLSMATGIGSGASETHDAAFQSIAKAEAFRISELFQRQLDKPFLAEEFPGKPILAYFEIAAQESTDPGTILDHAVKAKNAGFVMDAAEISEQTGYKLTPAPQPAAPAPFGALPDPAAAIPGLRATLNAEIDAATLRVAAKDMLAEAMDADLAPVRARIAAALALEDDDAMVAALRAVQADLPAILAEILAAPQAETALAEIAAQSLAEGAKAAAKERS